MGADYKFRILWQTDIGSKLKADHIGQTHNFIRDTGRHRVISNQYLALLFDMMGENDGIVCIGLIDDHITTIQAIKIRFQADCNIRGKINFFSKIIIKMLKFCTTPSNKDDFGKQVIPEYYLFT